MLHLAASRLRPLSSNVRPHNTRSMPIKAPRHRSQEQMQSQARPRSSEGSLSATRFNSFASVAGASMEQSGHTTQRKTNAVPCAALHGAGRPSAGGRLTTGCPRGTNAAALCRNAAAVWSMRATAVAARSSRASGQQSSAPHAWHCGQRPKVRPNPSFERTHKGRPRYTALLFSAPRGLPLRSAQFKR